MEIKQIIKAGENFNDRQLDDLCGGQEMMDNTNDAWFYCKCDGAGSNSNNAMFCRCRNKDNEPKPVDHQDPEIV